MTLRWRWPLAAALFAALAAALHFGLPGLAAPARGALLVFGAAIVAWTVLDLDETPVALLAVLALLASGATPLEDFYAGLGNEFIWLLIGAFVIAAVLAASGLAERWALALVASARTPAALMRRLSLFIIATAFVVPSTSGRAALLLPVFLALARALAEPRLARALALLFPSVILLSACVSMLGAGAHLVALDMMRQLSGTAPGFLGWIVLAAPFGVASSLLACELILHLFLSAQERQRALSLPPAPRMPMTRAQRAVAAIAALTLLGWASGGWHGIDAPLVALCGALAVTFKPLTGMDLKSALAKVEWNLVIFMAATLVMGEALLASGAATALAETLVASLSLQRLPPWSELVLAALIALLAHLVVTSRTARATVLIPTVALPFAAAGNDASLLVFLVALGSGFCQTLTVSAKPVAMFMQGGQQHAAPRDLLLLSAALLPGLWLLLSLCAVVL
ncbi:SLC13 family permease [Variovorax sp. YR752]|uniref:SLC13 family permease n=1 Tax=Variovorax sp. YR752 TaxID=1884383 RepID=UPI0031381D56